MNKAVKFHIKIPNGCWENGEKNLGVHFFLPHPVQAFPPDAYIMTLPASVCVADYRKC